MVYDFTMAAGGHQMVVTHEGYAIPLHVWNGLYYMDMYPASDDDLESFPHVFFTADAPWNPDIIHEEFFFDAINTLVDLPVIQKCRDACDPQFDMSCSMHSLSLVPSDLPITQEHFDHVVDELVIMSQTMKCHLPDLDALLPNFGWVSKDHICETLEKTSQHYKADQHIPMCKHFCSHFHAADVYCTNTFISDVLPLDDGVPGHGGCKMVQVYSGLNSELLSGHPMSSESELADTLHDLI